MRRDQLDRHPPAVGLVLGLVHRPHAPRADLAQQAELPESIGHGLGGPRVGLVGLGPDLGRRRLVRDGQAQAACGQRARGPGEARRGVEGGAVVERLAAIGAEAGRFDGGLGDPGAARAGRLHADTTPGPDSFRPGPSRRVEPHPTRPSQSNRNGPARQSTRSSRPEGRAGDLPSRSIPGESCPAWPLRGAGDKPATTRSGRGSGPERGARFPEVVPPWNDFCNARYRTRDANDEPVDAGRPRAGTRDFREPSG